MVLVEWMPAIIAGISVFAAAGTYVYQRSVDHQSDLVKKRQEIYSSHVIAIQKNMMGLVGSEEYNASLASIYIYGSDAVIRTVAALHWELADKAGKIDGRKTANAYSSMVAAMRADCFEPTNLNAEELVELVPFKYN